MLTYLSVKNLATVQEIKVEFQPGLNILTGSTGVGKSIILGSLGLILGEKGDSGAVRTGADSATVEAVFSVENGSKLDSLLRSLDLGFDLNSLAIRREVSQKGASRAFISDRVVTVTTLKQIGSLLVDLHGQHQHQSLLDTGQHLEYLDSWADLQKLRASLERIYSELRETEAALEKSRREQMNLEEKRDLFQFQISELERAQLKPGEDDELTREKSILENVEKLAERVNLALSALQEEQGSAVENLSLAAKQIGQASGWDPSLKEIEQRLQESLDNLKDFTRQLESYSRKLEYDPARLEFVRERLSSLVSLRRKYGKDINELITWQKELKERLEESQSSQGRVGELESRIAELRGKFKETCLVISNRRQALAGKLEKDILKHFGQLGLEKTRFQTSFKLKENPDSWLEVDGKKVQFDQTGFDQIEFLISPNPGEELKPLAKIASGGELSRIMLALKTVLAQKDQIPVLVFDEIDSGIGGEIAEAVGKKLKNLSRSHQIICITHLQQIASYADAHFKVDKEINRGRTVTSIRLLEKKERVAEIARMISGEKITPLAHKQASLMLEQAAQA